MRTPLLDALHEAEQAIPAAAQILKSGGLVAFPTETVYGLGALGLSPDAVAGIFTAKGRPTTDPLILHVGEPEWVEALVTALPESARLLMERFWPGPLTLVLPRSARVPDAVTAGLDSVAVRMPAHPVALALIRAVGEPVAAPSANRFGHVSPTMAEHVLADLDGRIDAVLDGGPTTLGVESTVLDLRGPVPVLLRPGGVSREALSEALGVEVALRTGPAAREDEAQVAPGLLTRHYSPQAAVHLYAGTSLTKILHRMAADAELLLQEGPAVVLAYVEDQPQFLSVGVPFWDLGAAADLEQVAQRLYSLLRQADNEGAAAILVRLLPPGGLADAINDRLLRAASGRLLTVE